MPRHAYLVLLALFLSGCGGGLASPTVTDTTAQPWLAGVARDFTATVNVPSGWKIDAVYVRYARHRWPGPQAAHDALASTDGATPGGYKTTGAGLASAPASHHLFYQWYLDYSPAGGGLSATVTSGPRDFVIGCTQAATDADLLTTQTTVLASFNTTLPHIVLPGLGYSVRPHGNASVADTGLGFASPSGGLLGTTPGLGWPVSTVLGMPGLLLYAPRPRDLNESEEDHRKLVSEPLTPDPPYRLEGWAYGMLYNPTNWPVMGCIPSSAWFVHEAGFHKRDGSMALYTPNEAVPGAAPVTSALPPADAPTAQNGDWWHPRVWDLHMWRATAPGAPPVLAIARPGGIVGLDATGLFFDPATFE